MNYSVEWIPKVSNYDCWNQWYVSEHKWFARWQYIEMLAVFGFSSDLKYRIREF